MIGRAGNDLGLEGAVASDLENLPFPSIRAMALSPKVTVFSVCNVLEMPHVSLV